MVFYLDLETNNCHQWKICKYFTHETGDKCQCYFFTINHLNTQAKNFKQCSILLYTISQIFSAGW